MVTPLSYWPKTFSSELVQNQMFSHLKNVLQFATTLLEHLECNYEFWNEKLDSYVNLADKAILETSLLLLVVSRVGQQDEVLSLINDLVYQLSSVVRTERNRVLLMRYPHTVAALGIGHFILTRLGNQDEEFDYLVRKAFESGYVEAIERLPYRVMDLLWLRGVAGLDAQSGFDSVLPHSILVSDAHPSHMSVADTYALTHAVMYMTDFGNNSLPKSVDAKRVSALIDAALAYHLLTENIDLLGELLLCAVILGWSRSPYVQIGWYLLSTIWNRLGFLPSPTFDVSAYSVLEGIEASSYAFCHLYHTTYVAGMLCSLMLYCTANDDADQTVIRWEHQALSDQCKNAIKLAVGFCDTYPNHLVDSDELLEKRLQDLIRNPVNLKKVEISDVDIIISRIREYSKFSNLLDSWLQTLSNAPLNNEKLVLVLTDTLLIHAIQDYKLPVLVEVLSFITNLDIRLSTTFRESVAFLIRQQVPCGAIGCYFIHASNCEKPEASEVTATLAHCLALVVRRLVNT